MHLFDCIWSQKQVPDSWHLARVSAIFKKGDQSLCSNFRPISLLSAGYKLFALVLLNRLRACNVDKYLWPSQFGFKRNARVTDALFMARRHIDHAYAKRDGKLCLLALDWAKAFDSIMPHSMIHALKRFGIPDDFLHMVNAIYSSRSFFVRDTNIDSTTKSQCAGISQGCPLSPVLFVMVMSVLISDARQDLVDQIGDDARLVSEILYADDTLIVDEHGDLAGIYMQCILKQGEHYGLSFNWDKISMICIGCNPIIAKPCGSNIECSHSMMYLGGVLSADGHCTSEINRRIGLASSEFSSLQKVWSHANLSVRKKIAIYQALIVPKLMYALEGIWLNQCQRKRLNSFHVGCIRRII